MRAVRAVVLGAFVVGLGGTAAGEEYNFDAFRVGPDDEILRFPSHAPKPGDPAPDFALETVDGRVFRLSEERGHPVLLLSGSLTCAETAASTSVLKKWHRVFGEKVKFVTLYVREQHPGERYPPHRTAAQKMWTAREWVWLDRIPWTVAVDTVDGEVDRRYGPLSNFAYLVDSTGHVAYRQLYAAQGLPLKGAIEHLLAAEAKGPPGRKVVLGERINLIVPAIRSVVEVDYAVRRGGEKALADMRDLFGYLPLKLAIAEGSLQPLVNPGNNEIE